MFFKKKQIVPEKNSDINQYENVTSIQFLERRKRDIESISNSLRDGTDGEIINIGELYLYLMSMRRKYEQMLVPNEVEKLRELTIYQISCNQDLVFALILGKTIYEYEHDKVEDLIKLFYFDIDKKEQLEDSKEDPRKVGNLIASYLSERLKLLVNEVSKIKPTLEEKYKI